MLLSSLQKNSGYKYLMTIARDGLFPQNVLVVNGPSSLPLWLVIITKKELSGGLINYACPKLRF